MKNRHVKKIFVWVLIGFIWTVGMGQIQITSAKQASSPTESKIGQKLVVPGLELKQENMRVLDYKQADVKGDSSKETVILAGSSILIDGKPDPYYFENLLIIVLDEKTKGYVTYQWDGELGRKPNLITGKYSSDEKDDIIVVARQGGNGGYVDHLILAYGKDEHEQDKLIPVFENKND